MAVQRVFRNHTYSLPESSFAPPAGKTFGGWLVNGTGSLRQPGDTITVTADVTLVAQWLDPYTITFNAGGGTGEMASVKVAQGCYFTVPNCSFTPPEGAVFDYWRRSDSGQAIWPGTGTIVNNDMTLTAQWKGPFVISFQPNGGTGLMGTRYAGYGESFIFPLCQFTPPAGKAFSHWHVTGKDTEYDITPANGTSIYCSLTVTPVWRTAEAVFKHNGGSGPIYNAWVYADPSDGCVVMKENTLTPPAGKMFAGWLVGDTVHQPGERVPIYGDTEIPAQWVDAHYTVTFDKNGGSGTMSSFVTNGDSFTLPECSFTAPAGKQFDYWIVSAAVTNYKLYYPGQTVQINADAVVQTIWTNETPTTVTLSFDPGDGSGTMASLTVPYNTPFALPDCGFTPPAGQVFSRWNFNYGYYDPGDQVSFTEDTVAVALYRMPNTYTVTFDNAWHGTAPAAQTVAEGGYVSDPGALTEAGYSFNGWTYTYTVGSGSDYTWETIPFDFALPIDYYIGLQSWLSEITVSADWTEHALHLNLNISNGGTASIRNAQETWQYGNGIYVDWEADEGYYLDSITLVPEVGDPVDVTYPEFLQPNFTMPDCDVVVEVVFCPLQPQITSGTCGDGLYWTLDEHGTLTISGMGAMTNYNAANNLSPFKGTSRIKNVVVQTGVTHIGSLIFWDCTELTSVSLPNGLQSIGTGAFQGCGLTEVEIPATVSSIDADAFCYCPLTSVTVPESMTVINRAAFRNLASLTEVNIHDGVTSIGVDAFYNANSLPYIHIPSSVTNISTGAFGKCYSLTEVDRMENVKTMGDYVFIHCQKLETLWLPRMNAIPDRTFEDCRALTHLAIPSSVTRIGDSAFKDCSALTQIFYEGCQSMWDAIEIGENNGPLENATLFCKFKLSFETYGGPEIEPVLLDWDEVPDRPEDPNRIGEYFTGWYLEATLDTLYEFDTPLNADTTLYAKYLTPDPRTTIRLPNALTTIESEAFAGAHVLFVAIPKTVTSIADDAFPLSTEYVLGYRNSAAESWASSHGIAFIEIDDTWMASH